MFIMLKVMLPQSGFNDAILPTILIQREKRLVKTAEKKLLKKTLLSKK